MELEGRDGEALDLVEHAVVERLGEHAVELTTDDPREIQRCYQLGCNVYITKPVEYEPFIEAIRRLGFFLQIVKIASNGPRAS